MKRSHGNHAYPTKKGVPKTELKRLNPTQKKVVKKVQQKRVRRAAQKEIE